MPSFDHPELVEFFSARRNRPEDLYPSERRFLPELAAGAETLLDVGCAAGGFLDIWRSYNPRISYTGVDVSEQLIEAARQLHPDARFLVGDCAAGLSLPDAAADVVAAIGWLHWEPRYAQALSELWRLTRHALFFDVRIVGGGDDIVGAQEIPGGATPYVAVAWEHFARRLLDLSPGAIRAYGYPGPPADTVTGVPAEVCMAAFVLERRGAPTQLTLELPLEWPLPTTEGVNS